MIEEKVGLEYAVGSGVLGPISKTCDKALMGMKKGEEASLKCTKDYAYGDKHPDGATITLTLQGMVEIKDVSFDKDSSLMKKQVKEGEGYDMPKDCAKCTLSVEAATDGMAALPGFTAKTLEFVAGNGEVSDALECAVAEMKKGERALLTVTKPALLADGQLGLKSVSAAQVVLTLELTEFEKAKDTYSMSEDEKVEFGTARKEVGSTLFKNGRLHMALQRYKKVGDIFNYIDNFKEENKVKAKELKKNCELNKALCCLKMSNYSDAKTACNAVLKDEKDNVKALYRRALAEHGLKNFIECIGDCKKVVELDNGNKDARALLKQAQAGQKEVDKNQKGMFANMCKALGKGPIPEPFDRQKRQSPVDDDEFEDDEPMGDESKDDEAMPPAEGEAEKDGDAKMADAAPAVAA